MYQDLKPRAWPLFWLLNLLFGDVLVAVVVMACINSQIEASEKQTSDSRNCSPGKERVVGNLTLRALLLKSYHIN